MLANAAGAVIAAAAALEVGTAAMLIVDPSLFSLLLFGADLTLPGQALGRLSGLSLLALAVACWPRRRAGVGARPAVQAMLLFSALAAAGLLFLGIGGSLIGVLLWPAAAVHVAFAVVLGLSWVWLRAPDH